MYGGSCRLGSPLGEGSSVLPGKGGGMYFDRSRPLTGKSIVVSSLSVNGPSKENRLSWIKSTGGSLDKDSCLVAARRVLQLGHFLETKGV